MKDRVKKNIRKNIITNLISLTLPMLLLNCSTIILICLLIAEIAPMSTIFILIIMIVFAIAYDAKYFKILELALHPEKSDIFKKYPDIEKILDNIEKTTIYSDEVIILSKEYVSDPNDYEKIIKYDDILGLHREIHKTNYSIDAYGIVIVDKYDQTFKFYYMKKDKNKCDEMLLLIASKCKNAEFGYTNQEQEHIKNNKIDLNKKSKKENNNEIEYRCPDCNKKIDKGDKFCKECGCKIDWT